MTAPKMAPVNPHITGQLRQLIYYHLDCNLIRNALFLAGRLHAYEPRSSEAAYLLALCHLRLGQLKAAYDSSRSSGSRGTHLGCSYVFAQACLGLERYVEGVTAIDRSRTLWSSRNSWGKHTESRRQHLPDASAVLCLQGKLWQAHCDTNKAIECYAEALKLNPFMWDAFLGLCDLGVNVRMANIFKMTPEMMSLLSSSAQEETPLGILDESPPTNALSQSQVNINAQLPANNDPFSISKNRINGDVRTNAGTLALFERLNSKKNAVASKEEIVRPDNPIFDTPTGPVAGADESTVLGKEVAGRGAATIEPPLAPVRKGRTLPGLGMDFSIDAPPKMRSNSTVRSKSKSKEESAEQDSITVSRSSTMSTAGLDLKRTVSGKAPQSTSGNARPEVSEATNDPGAPQRRSERLFNHMKTQSKKFSASTGSIGAKEGRELKKAKVTGTKGRSTNAFNVGRVVSGNRKHGDPMDIDGKEQRPLSNSATNATNHKPVVNEKVKEYESVQWLLDLFMKLGSGYFALSHYQCQDALRCFNSITTSQRETPWVLAQIGRAHYEQTNYVEAEKIFTRIKSMAPSRLEDMEIYSTILWHLKHPIDLAYLAHEIVDIDRNSPQAWCTVGNSFSLQRDHDQALKCFIRATQLDPKFAYAFTLQGHEHVANEEYDKALSAYRAAIGAESRHYNAWYGLARVFEKQGKYNFAEQHYRTAASINPTNPVLVTCIGNVLEKTKSYRPALVQYSKACELDPKSPLCRFKKARVLMALHEHQKALIELKVLKDIAPDEANVHFLLGKVYKVLRQKGSAIKHFTMALNLDPKASHYIKEAMEQMEDEDDDEDADM